MGAAVKAPAGFGAVISNGAAAVADVDCCLWFGGGKGGGEQKAVEEVLEGAHSILVCSKIRQL